MSGKKKWRTYEEVAQYLLEQLGNYFGLGRVEGKQLVPGASGTSWEIEAKGLVLTRDLTSDLRFRAWLGRHYR
jgi:hypothetical protein